MPVVYFMQPIEGGPVKIGTTVDIGVRKRELEAILGKRLVILKTIEGSYEEEAQWHNRFSHLRIERTEQFRPALELMEAIGCPGLASPDLVSVERINFVTDAINVRVAPEYKSWAVEFAAHEKRSTADLLDVALVEYARARGFKMPPKR